MIFRKYAAFFQPHELDALTAAYDAAWQHMLDTSVIDPAQASVLKKKLAQIILASACTGERDVERLKDIALLSVSGGRGAKEPQPADC
jgi:hypothetical protein